ncbi:MAG: thiamine phosphate synthase [Huintestinicola sp.]|uniref:thiamine phosphate synthase n=1 Tax=Huintestinicola sp. TaxID=2981661 RepID=UPI003F07B6FE
MKNSFTLYAITDSSYTRLPLSAQTEAAISGGADIIQLREKNISEEEYVKKAEEVLAVTRKYGVPLIINDNVNVALRSGAEGVHLGQTDGDPASARKILGANAIIGVTAKTVSQAKAAEAAGADYLGSGAMFVSPTKPGAKALSMSELREICSSVSIPVCAIGGINEENATSLRGSGISGIAVVSAVFGSETTEGIAAAAKRLRAAAEDIIK